MPVKPYRGTGEVFPIGQARFLWWALAGFRPGDRVEPAYGAIAAEVERMIPEHLAGTGLDPADVRVVDSSVAGTFGALVRGSDAALAELERQLAIGLERNRDVPYATRACPVCAYGFPTPPKGKRSCPGCKTPIHVLRGADARRYLVADPEVITFEAEQERLRVEAERGAGTGEATSVARPGFLEIKRTAASKALTAAESLAKTRQSLSDSGAPAWALAWFDEPQRLVLEFPRFASAWIRTAEADPDALGLRPSGCLLVLAQHLPGLGEIQGADDVLTDAIFDRLAQIVTDHPRTVAATYARMAISSYPVDMTGDIDRANRYLGLVSREDPWLAELATDDIRSNGELRRGVATRRSLSVARNDARQRIIIALHRYALEAQTHNTLDTFAGTVPLDVPETAVAALAGLLRASPDSGGGGTVVAAEPAVEGSKRRRVLWASMEGLNSRLVVRTGSGRTLVCEDFGALGEIFVDKGVTVAYVRLARSPKSPDSEVGVLVDLVAGGRRWTRPLIWRDGDAKIDVAAGVVRVTLPYVGPVEYLLSDGSTDEDSLMRRILACSDARLSMQAVEWALSRARAASPGQHVDVSGARASLREAAVSGGSRTLRSRHWRVAGELAELEGDVDDAIDCYELALTEGTSAGVTRRLAHLRATQAGG